MIRDHINLNQMINENQNKLPEENQPFLGIKCAACQQHHGHILAQIPKCKAYQIRQ